nr:GTPase [Megamonas hypermegale]
MKLKNLKPQVMVYGIYNAGKSSIINELLKADKAIVNDKPTTDRIDYYEWNGYEIADTPGVGAPIEHEEVTNAHLKKADVVLFVMSTTGSNEKAENYTRMKNIVDAGKKVIIILNDKNGDLYSNNKNISAIKVKVMQNMQKVNIADVESKYCIVVVNAARAKKARLLNKPAFYDKSNFAELERIILSELKNTSTFNVIGNTIYEIEQSLKELIKIFNDNLNSDDVKQLNNILTTLRQQKIDIRKDVNEYIKNKTGRLAEILPDVIWSKRNKQEEINQYVQDEIEKIVNNVQRHLENKLKDLQDILIVDFENLITHLDKIKVHSIRNINVKDVNVEKSGIVEDDDFDIVSILSTTKNILDTVEKGASIFGKSAKGKIIPDIVPDIATTIIPKIVPSVIAKSAVGAAIGGVASKFIPYIGPIISVVSVLKSVLGDDEEERQRRHAQAEAENEYKRKVAQAEQQARQDLQQKCLYLADDISEDLSYTVNDIIRNTISGLENVLKEKISSKNETVNGRIEALNKIQLLLDEYDSIRIELKGSQSA